MLSEHIDESSSSTGGESSRSLSSSSSDPGEPSRPKAWSFLPAGAASSICLSSLKPSSAKPGADSGLWLGYPWSASDGWEGSGGLGGGATGGC